MHQQSHQHTVRELQICGVQVQPGDVFIHWVNKQQGVICQSQLSVFARDVIHWQVYMWARKKTKEKKMYAYCRCHSKSLYTVNILLPITHFPTPTLTVHFSFKAELFSLRPRYPAWFSPNMKQVLPAVHTRQLIPLIYLLWPPHSYLFLQVKLDWLALTTDPQPTSVGSLAVYIGQFCVLTSALCSRYFHFS